MREQNRAFAYSVGIHLIVFMLVFGVMRTTTPAKRTLIIDFSLGDQPAAPQSAQSFPKAEPKSVSVSERVHRPVFSRVSEQRVASANDVVIQPEPRVQLMTGVGNQVTATTPEAPPSSAPDSATAAQGYDGSAGYASSSGPERPEMRYVKAHFAGIRNVIISKLSYPRAARRMGWTGTVKVSFVVNEDGGVSNVRVLATSGFELLDNNAVETIRRCSPYPKPPCRAEMVMPVTYRLDE